MLIFEAQIMTLLSGCILDSVEGLHHERAEFDQDIVIWGLDHASVEWLHHERAECDPAIVILVKFRVINWD